MINEYYQYSREQLLECPKIPLEVGADNEAVFRAMADEMVEEIQSRAALGRTCVFICPVGPVGQYPFFVERVNRENISLKHCWFINMDEYLDGEKKWVPMSHPLSFRGFMEREVYSQIRPELNVPEGQRVFPDPDNLAYIPELIEKLGGVDVCFGGIGLNGHLAFNEADPSKSPEEFIALKTRVLPISPGSQRHRGLRRGAGGYAQLLRHHRVPRDLSRPQDSPGGVSELAPGGRPQGGLRDALGGVPRVPAPGA